jgi:hypothetical protein
MITVVACGLIVIHMVDHDRLWFYATYYCPLATQFQYMKLSSLGVSHISASTYPKQLYLS